MTALPPDPLGWVSPEEYAVIRATTATFPPLTDDQRSRLALLLSPARRPIRNTRKAGAA